MRNTNDRLEITSNMFSGHGYAIGDIVDILEANSIGGEDYYETINRETGQNWTVDSRDAKLHSTTKITTKTMSTFKQAVLDAATKLLKANNTVTTLEIKTELRTSVTTSSLYSTQDNVSSAMQELEQEGKFIFVDTGVYRIYSDPQKTVTPTTTKQQIVNTVATSRVSTRKALDLIRNSKGHFFTVEFIKQDDNKLRTMNCQYLSGQDIDPLGVIKVKEASKLKAYNKLVKLGQTPKKDYIRSFNVSTLKSLSIGGQNLKIRK